MKRAPRILQEAFALAYTRRNLVAEGYPGKWYLSAVHRQRALPALSPMNARTKACR